MHLAKPCLDIGLFTENKEAMLAFYRDEVGLPYEELLPTGGGAQQHRHGLNGSVFKLNHVRDPLPEAAPSGYTRLHIAREGLAAPRDLVDPDGNLLRLVPKGAQGIEGFQIDIAVHEIAKHRHFWGTLFGGEDVGGDRFRIGTTLVALHGGAPARADLPMRARGFRYLTVQVWDTVAEHEAIVGAGAWEGNKPWVLGDVARISFIRDPDGNWIEISQRRSLTGSLA